MTNESNDDTSASGQLRKPRHFGKSRNSVAPLYPNASHRTLDETAAFASNIGQSAPNLGPLGTGTFGRRSESLQFAFGNAVGPGRFNPKGALEAITTEAGNSQRVLIQSPSTVLQNEN